MRLNRGTLILVVVLAVIIVAAVLLLNREPASGGDGQSTPVNEPLFADVTTDTVTSLTVQSRSSDSATATPAAAEATPEADETAPETVILALALDDGGSWQVAEDSTLESERPVDQEQVETALSTLVNLRYRDRFESEAVEQFGLDDPQHEVTFTADETSYRLRVGDRNPTGTQYYALLGDDEGTVYLLSSASSADRVLNLADDPPFVPEPTPTPEPVLNLPGPVFSDFNATAVTELSLTDHESGEELVLLRDAETSEWTLEGSASPVDQTAMSVLSSDIGTLSAVDGLPGDNLEALGLAEPAYTIALQQNDDTTLTLQIGGHDPSGTRYYALVNDFEEVAVVPVDPVDTALDLFANPPLLPEVTPEATSEATGEPTEAVDESETSAEATATPTD